MLARNGLLALSIAAGIQVLKTMLDVEVEEKAGPKGKHNKDRTIYSYGTEKTSVVLDGQKVKIERPRLCVYKIRKLTLKDSNSFSRRTR